MLHLEVTEVIKNYVVAKLLETVTLLIQTPVISVKPIDYYMYTLINNGNRRNKNNPNPLYIKKEALQHIFVATCHHHNHY